MSQSTKTKKRPNRKKASPTRIRHDRPAARATRAAHPAGRSRSRRNRKVHPLVAAVATVAALGLVAAILSFAGSGGVDDGPSWAAVEVSGSSLPAFVRGGTDPAVGMKAPEVRGTGFDGGDVVIAPTGRRQVVVFLAHWCPHCRNEVPALVSWWNDRGMAEDVDLYAVSTWADTSKPNFPPGRWLREERWPVATLVDDGDSNVGRAFGLQGTPFWVFLDGVGRVLGRIEAELGGADLERALQMPAA